MNRVRCGLLTLVCCYCYYYCAAAPQQLPTKATAAEACKKGFIVLCPDMDSAISVSDSIAPEHLEIQTKDAQAVADR
jgi:histidinol dehydrogenase